MIYFRSHHLLFVSVLLAGCANAPSAHMASAPSGAPANSQVAFSDDLRDLPDRSAVETLLISNESMNENTIRRKNYVSAAGQDCSMLEVASQESSLVACRDANGVWNVHRAYGDMDLSANLPPPPVADEQTKFAAIDEQPRLQPGEQQEPVITTYTIHNAVIGEIPPLSQTNMAIAQGVSVEDTLAYEVSMQEMAAHMNLEANTPPLPSASVTASQAHEPATRWTERRSSAVTLISDKPRNLSSEQPRRSLAYSNRRP